MRKVTTLIIVLLFLLAVGGATMRVLADSPHFNAEAADWQTVDGANLQVSWKESGLGDNLLISYVASADSTAVYACINGGDNHPQAANKEVVSGPVSASGIFSSGKNGNIVASLVLAPTSQGAFSCPSGQSLVLVSVSYSNIAITDMTTPIGPVNIDGIFTRCFVDPGLGLCL